MTSQTCENCGKPNPDESNYCYACGHILPAGLNAIATHALPNGEPLKPQIRWGTAYFGETSLLRIHIRHTGEVVEARFKKECVLGRKHADSEPDVDLGPFGAVDLGVSRLHAKLTEQTYTVMVQDLGSRNGTFLNGERLIPKQPRVLRNEDELRLGHLVLRISFLNAPESPAIELPPPSSPLPPST